MFGFADVWINVAFLFCLGSTILCVGYGILNWNEGLEAERSLEFVSEPRIKKTKESVVLVNDN